MNVKTDISPNLNALIQPEQETTDPAYLAWRDAKVSKALAASKAHPERRIPQAEVWKKYGLES